MSDQIFFSRNETESRVRQLARRQKAGKLRRIGPGIYTDNLTDPIEDVCRRHAITIAGTVCRDCVLSGRSAFEMRPVRKKEPDGVDTGDATLFLSGPGSRRTITLPGLQIRVVPGPGPLEGDNPFMGLWAASTARAALENLAPSRSRGGPPRTLGQKAVEKELEKLYLRSGDEALNALRDEARALAPLLGLDNEYEKLDGIIGTILGTRKAALESSQARARAEGKPFDPDCVARLTALAKHLASVALPNLTDPAKANDCRIPLCFIEAYFSNYIEGTRFAVDEARRIVFDEEIPVQRPADGHDVLATYQQLAELDERLPSSLDYAEFRDELMARHASIMGARPDKSPGRFKRAVNFAGNTVFVHPDLVEGTLRRGMEILTTVEHPFGRGVFLHFLIADVHPFDDGNGRISGIIMTKELVGSNLCRVVIPTVYRENYLDALRCLTRRLEAAPLERTLAFAQKLTNACTANDLDYAIDLWATTYGFLEGDAHARLEMPDPAREIEWANGLPRPVLYRQYSEADRFGFSP